MAPHLVSGIMGVAVNGVAIVGMCIMGVCILGMRINGRPTRLSVPLTATARKLQKGLLDSLAEDAVQCLHDRGVEQPGSSSGS